MTSKYGCLLEPSEWGVCVCVAHTGLLVSMVRFKVTEWESDSLNEMMLFPFPVLFYTYAGESEAQGLSTGSAINLASLKNFSGDLWAFLKGPMEIWLLY